MDEQESARKTRVIAVGNQKGGVGKTTNCIQLAGALAELGKKSLVIDLDVTNGATRSLRAPTEGWVGTYEMLTGTPAEDCIIDEEEDEVPMPPGINLIPSSKQLEDFDSWLQKNRWVVQQDVLLGPIAELRGRYDFIWLDTPPQTTTLSIPALKAADYAVLSCMPDQLAVTALIPAIGDIRDAQKGPNPELVVLGIIMNSMPKPRTRLASALIAEMEEAAPNLKFETDLSRTVVLQEATKTGQTIFQYMPESPIAEQYRALAREFVARIEQVEGVAQSSTEEEPKVVSIEPAAAPEASDKADDEGGEEAVANA